MELTQELVKELFDYHEDGYLIWKVDRDAAKMKGKRADTINIKVFSTGRIKKVCFVKINSKGHLAHRLIFLWHHGYLPPIIDHEDRNTLNNKIENLREASSAQNAANRTSSKNSTSKYLGVHLNKKRWISAIRFNNHRVIIGIFKTEKDAALAYNREAVKLHKEFANLNIIMPSVPRERPDDIG